MTTEETFQKLSEMRVHGLARALREQLDTPDSYQHLAFEDRIGILVDREWTDREARSLSRRLQLAKLRDRRASIEDIDFQHPRGLDRTLTRRLATASGSPSSRISSSWGRPVTRHNAHLTTCLILGKKADPVEEFAAAFDASSQPSRRGGLTRFANPGGRSSRERA